MPRPATQLRIPTPCHESWAAMTPTGSGRHCAACQKVVVDFTQQTDGEILAYLARASHACGRFRADQLGRPLLPPAAPSRWRSWLASVLALGGVLGGSRAAAQSGGNYFSAGPTPTAVQPAAPAAEPLPTPANVAASATPAAPGPAGESQVLRGVVLDASNGELLPGAMVVLDGTSRGANTDAAGRFELPLTAADTGRTLVIALVGYESRRLPLTQAGTEPLTVKLQASHVLMGEVVITAVGRQPWPWHPRRLYQWSKYQLLRPFRR